MYIYISLYIYIHTHTPLYIHMYVHTHTATMIKESKAINLRECNKRGWKEERKRGVTIIL